MALPRYLYIVMVASIIVATDSCALFEAIHPQLREVQPVQSPLQGPLAGLREVIDARSSTTIGQVMGKPEQDKRVIVGSEIVAPATTLIANQLANKGYRVVRTPFQTGGEVPSRVVVAVLKSLEARHTELDVSVDELSGQAVFRQTYTASGPPGSFGQFLGYLFSSRFGMADKLAAMALAAINQAAEKMCADRAFIAALTPAHGA